MTGALEVGAFVVLLVLAYLAGSIPFGLVVGKLFYHVDIREHGSGNVGTTNTFRVLGKKAGVAVLICDMLKGFIPAFIAAQFFNPWFAIFIAAAPVVGHMYSIFLKGSGGKGVATGAAVVLALVPVAFLIILVVWLVLLLTTRYVSVASLVASFLVPVLVILFHDPLPYQIAAVLVAIIVWWAHRGNIRRLLTGKEHRANLFGRTKVGQTRAARWPAAGGGRRVDVTVIGSGSWGSAFSRLLVMRGHAVDVLTLTREEAVVLNERHENPHFLPGVALARRPSASWRMEDAEIGDAELIVYAVPTQVVREVARWVAQRRSPRSLQLSLAKGYELGTLERPTQVIAAETGSPAVAALSGPNHAEEVGRDMPSATVIAAADDHVSETLQAAITSDTFRVYTNDDVLGVEFCGAVKNPIAVAVGMSDGLGFGDNSRASLITRSAVEMTRLGIVQGARMETFTGLAGIGDLIATCTSRHSRNRLAGELLAKGASPAEVEKRGRARSWRASPRPTRCTTWPSVWASTCRSPRTSTRCSRGDARRRSASPALWAGRPNASITSVEAARLPRSLTVQVLGVLEAVATVW